MMYAATLTRYSHHNNGEYGEWRSIITRGSLEALKKAIAKEEMHSDEVVGLKKAFIHKRTYSVQEARQLRLMAW